MIIFHSIPSAHQHTFSESAFCPRSIVPQMSVARRAATGRIYRYRSSQGDGMVGAYRPVDVTTSEAFP